MFLLASTAFPPQDPFDILKIGECSKLGKEHFSQMGDMNKLLTSVLGLSGEKKDLGKTCMRVSHIFCVPLVLKSTFYLSENCLRTHIYLVGAC